MWCVHSNEEFPPIVSFPCIPSWLALSLTSSAYFMSTSLAWYSELGSQQSVGHMLAELVCVNSSLQGMMN